jgi:hypothetical protein
VPDNPTDPVSQPSTESTRAGLDSGDQQLSHVEHLPGTVAGLVQPVDKPLTPTSDLVDKPLTPSPERVSKPHQSRGKPRGRPRKNPA